MVSKIDSAFQFDQTALRLRSARQELLASNIANADTPKYKAKDFNFASALQTALTGNKDSYPLTTTHPIHFSEPASGDATGIPIKYRNELQPNADGNTVDMDVERTQFADNALRYEASVSFVTSGIKDVLAALAP